MSNQEQFFGLCFSIASSVVAAYMGALYELTSLRWMGR